MGCGVDNLQQDVGELVDKFSDHRLFDSKRKTGRSVV
jgi:hypothetical protein